MGSGTGSRVGGRAKPGDWVKVLRRFRDGHEQEWWALEVDVGPYGPQRVANGCSGHHRPRKLPDKATWYVVTNLPHLAPIGRASSEQTRSG